MPPHHVRLLSCPLVVCCGNGDTVGGWPSCGARNLRLLSEYCGLSCESEDVVVGCSSEFRKSFELGRRICAGPGQSLRRTRSAGGSWATVPERHLRVRGAGGVVTADTHLRSSPTCLGRSMRGCGTAHARARACSAPARRSRAHGRRPTAFRSRVQCLLSAVPGQSRSPGQRHPPRGRNDEESWAS